MGLQKKTLNLIEKVSNILEEYHPMTLRQIYYQLVSRQVIENIKSEYSSLSSVLVNARKEGLIPWEWVEDRTRRPRDVNMWDDLEDFLKTVKRAYRRDVWANQDNYVLVWLEKDALSGIFEAICNEYGVTLVVGRGYNSWSIRKELADRFNAMKKQPIILYFGDFDPSGEDICRDLYESFTYFQISPKMKKVALTNRDVIEYKLPPDYTKKTDTRSKKFVEKYGDMAVELDALPIQVLQEKVRGSIEENLDMVELANIRSIEQEETSQLNNHI